MAVGLLFSYDPGLLSDRDWVRFYVGDTAIDRAEMDDRELDALLLETTAPDEDATVAEVRSYRQLVASQAADAIAAKYAREADVSFENQRSSLSAKFAQYHALALRLKSLSHGAMPLKTERV